MKIELTCPLGSKCETAKDDTLYRCAWFTKLQGKNPQDGKEIDEWGCAIAWMPVLQIENANQVRSVHAATCDMRNHASDFQQGLLNIAQQRLENGNYDRSAE